MHIEWATTTEHINTQWAPLGALMLMYHHAGLLSPLQDVCLLTRAGCYTDGDHLIQLLMAIFTGCESLVQVNTVLAPERALAALFGWPRFADQSTLSRSLDRLSLTNFSSLRTAFLCISTLLGGVWQHDYRGYLYIDVDLSALPASRRAEGSTKGYVSGKKTCIVANWYACMRLNMARA